MDDLDHIRQAAAQSRLPQPAGDRDATATGLLVQMESSRTSCWVSVYDSEPVLLPCSPGAWAGITTVAVLTQAGRPVRVLGPAGVPAIDEETKTSKREEVVNPPKRVETIKGKMVRPAWSGTWRQARGAYDRWNVGMHGGRSDLYQGSNGSSGQLIGVAVYGSQILNLAASQITKAVVTLIPNGSIGAGLSIPVVLQAVAGGGTPAGAPALVGPTTTTGGLTAGKTTSFALPEQIRELLRTGQAGGLALVGSQYQAVYGTSKPAGMALTLDYTTEK